MAIRIPLVQVNGRLVELQAGDKFHTEIIQNFEFVQETPANVWVIEHNMNKYPSIVITLEDGSVISGLKFYNSPDKITLSFSRPISGKAFLN